MIHIFIYISSESRRLNGGVNEYAMIKQVENVYKLSIGARIHTLTKEVAARFSINSVCKTHLKHGQQIIQ